MGFVATRKVTLAVRIAKALKPKSRADDAAMLYSCDLPAQIRKKLADRLVNALSFLIRFVR